jgi:hypothetical protein
MGGKLFSAVRALYDNVKCGVRVNGFKRIGLMYSAVLNKGVLCFRRCLIHLSMT